MSQWFVDQDAEATATVLPYTLPFNVSAGTSLDCQLFSDVEFQFAGPGTVTVKRSLNGQLEYVPWTVSGKTNTGVDVVSAAVVGPGIYILDDGNGWLRFSQPVVVARRA